MPAASCRIMPARSISRCDTISASFGFSLRMGRKNRDNRMGTPEELVRHGKPAVKPDRVRKHKGGDQQKPLTKRISCRFADRRLEAAIGLRQAAPDSGPLGTSKSSSSVSFGGPLGHRYATATTGMPTWHGSASVPGAAPHIFMPRMIGHLLHRRILTARTMPPPRVPARPRPARRARASPCRPFRIRA